MNSNGDCGSGSGNAVTPAQETHTLTEGSNIEVGKDSPVITERPDWTERTDWIRQDN